MDGVSGTLYEGEQFQLLFKFNNKYPFDSPEVIYKLIPTFILILFVNCSLIVGHICRIKYSSSPSRLLKRAHLSLDLNGRLVSITIKLYLNNIE